MPITQEFTEAVLQIARLIPYGRVTSYGAIGRCVGTKQSARMVGWVLSHTHHSQPPVPAHRVLNRNGLLSGKHHFDTPTQMQELLEAEGIEVLNDKVVQFEKLFWDPIREIEF